MYDFYHACFRKARATFDTTEVRKEFGPVVIDYAKVQSKVSLKYDSWHKDVLSKFGSQLGIEMTDFHSTVSKVKYTFFIVYIFYHVSQ